MQPKQQEIVAEFVKLLEDCVAKDWEFPWNGMNYGAVNGQTGQPFKGGNAMWLSLLQIQKKYSSNQWATAKQWNQIGGMVVKGERCGSQYASRPIVITNKETDETFVKNWIPYPVFNRDQVEGLPKIEKKEGLPEKFKQKHIEDYLHNTNIEVQHSDQPRAFYSIRSNHIHMPNFETFKTWQGYYATSFHEHIHATGHKDIMDREGITKSYRDSKVYAKEELIAELGASFLCAKFEIYMERRDDHVAYLKSWISTLKETPSVLWKASSDAQNAVDWIEEQQITDLKEEHPSMYQHSTSNINYFSIIGADKRST